MKKGQVYYCTLCGYIATSEEELDFHYRMSHEEGDIILDDDFVTDNDVW